MSGNAYRDHCGYWDDRNPHLSIESQINQPDDTTNVVALSSEDIIGPVFFDGTVTGSNHLEMFRDVVVSQLRTEAKSNQVCFQLDGAPPHYAQTVREYFDQAFLQLWFGRRRSIKWPPRLPDLTPKDFFFGGVVKNKVYERNSHTVNEE